MPSTSTVHPAPPAPSGQALMPLFAALTAALLWGGSFSAAKIALATFSPMSLMWLRMTLATLLLLPLAHRVLPRNVQRKDLKLLAATCLLMPCGYFLFEANALRLTTSTQAGVISSFVPLLVALGAAMFLGEALTRRVVAGLALSMAGVAWLSLSGTAEGSDSAPAPLLGNALEFLAMVCAAGSMLLVKRLSGRYGPWSLTAMQTMVGAVFFLPGATGVDTAPWDWPPEAALAVLFLGGLVTLGAFGLYNWALSRLAAARVSAFINLVPLVAVAFGWLFLGETLTPLQCLAAVMIISGVALSQGRWGMATLRRYAPEHG